MRRVLVCLALCACGQDGAISPVQIAGVGTLASGEAVVLLRQTWQGARDIYEKTGGLVVHADGGSEAVMLPQPLLISDCSDTPASLGECIAAAKTTNGEVSMWSFALAGGDRLVASDAPTSQSLTRIDAGGAARWTLYGVARPDGAIRDGTLLVINARYASASKIAVDSGAALWTVSAPPRL